MSQVLLCGKCGGMLDSEGVRINDVWMHPGCVTSPPTPLHRPEPNCRTCAHCFVVQMGQAPDVACWQKCTNGDRYEPLPPVRLWRTT